MNITMVILHAWDNITGGSRTGEYCNKEHWIAIEEGTTNNYKLDYYRLIHLQCIWSTLLVEN